MNPFSLQGKNVLITGASSGLGRQTAITCSHLGANLVLVGRNKERLQQVQQQLAEGCRSLTLAMDLCQFESYGQALARVKSELGLLDGLVHSAGISTTLPLRLSTAAKLQDFYQVNVVAAIELTRLATGKAYWSAEGGSVVFLSSVMAMAGEAGKTIYSLTKGALISGARSLAIEMASRKIRVNCIAPGVVETPMTRDAVYNQSEEGRQRITGLHPLGLGCPEDVAHAAAYLCSPAARWVTGTTLVVDGGYSAR